MSGCGRGEENAQRDAVPRIPEDNSEEVQKQLDSLNEVSKKQAEEALERVKQGGFCRIGEGGE